MYSIIHQKGMTSAKTKDLILDKYKHYGISLPSWANQSAPQMMPYYNQENEVT